MEVTKFDVIFSIGVACRPAYYLRRYCFRRLSCPLDWQMNYSLDTVTHLFKTKFRDFFEEIEEDDSYTGVKRKVWDIKNQICSVHHFDRETDLKLNQECFREIMSKRFERLDQKLKKADSIGIICNRGQSIDKLEEFLKIFSRIYPQKKVVLINVRDENTNDRTVEQHVIDEYLEIHEYVFRDKEGCDEENWRGNRENWIWVLRHYELHQREDMKKLTRCIGDRKLVIYGAGEMAQIVMELLGRNHLQVDGIAVTDTAGNSREINGVKVKSVDEYDLQNTVIVVAVEDKQICKEMIDYVGPKAYKVGCFDAAYGEIRFIGED